MNPELMKFVEWLLRRNIHFAVTSAFRTMEQNDACNGSKNSQHLTGDAVDLAPVDEVSEFVSSYLRPDCVLIISQCSTFKAISNEK